MDWFWCCFFAIAWGEPAADSDSEDEVRVVAAPPRAARCAICLDAVAYREGDPAETEEAGDPRAARLALCGHRFHRGCLAAWLERAPRCPVCRREQTPPGQPMPDPVYVTNRGRRVPRTRFYAPAERLELRRTAPDDAFRPEPPPWAEAEAEAELGFRPPRDPEAEQAWHRGGARGRRRARR